MVYTAPDWGYATNFQEIQIFLNEMLRIINKLPWITPIDVLHDETDMTTIKRHASRLTRKLLLAYLESQFRGNCHIRG
jgi:hypothetical protein